jgi:hypothetical protein
MCLIGIKSKGTPVTKLLKDSVNTAFHSNRDGMGLALKRAGSKTIWMKKGYFDINKVMHDIDSLNIQTDDEFMFHGRMCTAGIVSAQNTHPFVMGETFESMTLHNDRLKYPVFMHNGCIGELTYHKAIYSDTAYLNLRLFSGEDGKINIEKLKQDPEQFAKIYEKYIGWGKFSFMFPDVDIIMIGDFTEDPVDKGYFFSHGGYRNSRYIDKGGVRQLDIPELKVPTDSDEDNYDTTLPVIINAGPAKPANLTDTNPIGFRLLGKGIDRTATLQEQEDALATAEFAEYVEMRYNSKSTDELSCSIDDCLSKSSLDIEEITLPSTKVKNSTNPTLGYNKAYSKNKTDNNIKEVDDAIQLRSDNAHEVFLKAGITYGSYLKDSYYVITRPGSNPKTYYVKDASIEQAIAPEYIISMPAIRSYFTIVPKQIYEGKYQDYQRCCHAYTPSKNLAKKISKTMETSRNKLVCNTKKLRSIYVSGLREYYKTHLEHLLSN